jgi:glutathione S-transferase
VTGSVGIVVILPASGARACGTLADMQKPTLIYFEVRGRGEVIRLLLAEAGVDWHEHPITQGGAPQGGRPTDFAEIKASGLLPFDAAPVWEEPDGFRLAQSRAIECHIARTHGLYGATAREAAQCDQALGAGDDIRVELRKLVTAAPDERAPLREKLVTSFLPRWMGYLDRLLAANRGGDGYFVGAGVSVADLALYYVLEILRDNGLGAPVERSPRLLAFFERVAARPRLRAYLDSPRRFPVLRLPA